jgi:hypothetical protein
MSTTTSPTTTQSPALKSASYLLRLNPQEKAELEAKARAYAERTGERMSLASALREGATRYLDELLGDPPTPRRLEP